MPTLLPALPKVAPLVRLLGSDKDGEVLAAAHGLRRVLAAVGADLNDLATFIESRAANRPEPAKEPKAARPRRRRENEDWCTFWKEAADALLVRGRDTLGERDLEFLRNVSAAAARGKQPSPAQRKWLKDIRKKIGESNG